MQRPWISLLALHYFPLIGNSVAQIITVFPSQLAVTASLFAIPGQIKGGVSFGPTIVEFKDSNFTTVPVNDARLIQAILIRDSQGSFQDGFSSLYGTTSLRMGVDSRDGIAIFSNLIIDKVCSACKILFISGSLFVYSVSFQVVQGPPSIIRFLSFPDYGVAGLDLTPPPAIQTLDAGGNLITERFNASVTKTSGYGDLLSRNSQYYALSSSENNYSAVFKGLFISTANVFVDSSNVQGGQTTAPYFLSFSVSFLNSSGASNSTIKLSAVAPGVIVTESVTKAILTGKLLPSSVAAAPLLNQPTLSLFDSFNELVVSNAGALKVIAMLFGGTLGAKLEGNTSISSINGIVTFTDLFVDKIGVGYFLSFSSGSAFPAVNSTPFNVTPGQPVKLHVAVQPGSTIAGNIFFPYPKVEVQDAGSNVIPSTFVIAVTVIKGAGLYPSPVSQSFVNTVRGSAEFNNLSLTRTGLDLNLRFYTGQDLSTISSPFDVFPSSAAKIVLINQPGSAIRGAPLSIQPSLQLQDSFGNLISFGLPVLSIRTSLSFNAGMGTLAGRLVQIVQNGSVSFKDLSINNPAIGYTLRFYVNLSIPNSWTDSSPFNISGVPSGLVILKQPQDSIGGQIMQPAPHIAVVDSDFQYVMQSTGLTAIAFIRGSSLNSEEWIGVIIPDQIGFIFPNITVSKAGQGNTLIFKVLTTYTSFESVSQPFAVLAGEPSAALFLVQPSNCVAGIPMYPPAMLGITDRGGNLALHNGPIEISVLNSNHTLIFSSAFTVFAFDGIANLSHTFYSADSGLQLVGTLYLSAFVSIKSKTFDVLAGRLTFLDIIVQPESSIRNQTISPYPIIALRDVGGNLVIGLNRKVTVSRGIGPAGAYIIGTLANMPISGIAEFNNLKITETSKAFSLVFSILTLDEHVLSVESVVFSVTNPPASLILNAFPSKVDAETLFDASLSFLDQGGSLVKVSADPVFVNASLISGQGHQIIIQGHTITSFYRGVANFSDLVISKVGMYRLHFFSLHFAVAAALEVIPGLASALVVVTQPIDGINSTVFFVSPAVQIVDSGGNGVQAEGTANVKLLQNSAGSRLIGTLSRNFSSGFTAFIDLEIQGLGNGFTLQFCSGLLCVQSNQFSVYGNVRSLALLSFPVGAINVNSNIQFESDIVVAILDIAGNIINGGTYRPPYVAITAYSTSGVSLATQAILNGLAHFKSLAISSPVTLGGAGMKLNFQCNVSCVGVSSPYFFVSPATECRLTFLQQQSAQQFAGQVLTPMPRLVVETRNPVSGLFEPVRGSIIQVVVSARDDSNNIVSLSGTTSVQAAAGIFFFTDLTISKASNPKSAGYLLTFLMVPTLNAESLICKSDVTGSYFSVEVGSAVTLLVSRDLSNPSINGLPFSIQPCLTLIDAGSNKIQAESPVSASLMGDNYAANLRGGLVVMSYDGIASFTDLLITGAKQDETFQISFFSLDLLAMSSPFTVKTGLPYSISILVQPTDSEAMVPMKTAPLVSVQDAGGTAVFDQFEITANLYEPNNISMIKIFGNKGFTTNGVVFYPFLTFGRSQSSNILIFAWQRVFSVASASFNIFVGSASGIIVGMQPNTNVVGVDFMPEPTVVIVDAGGNTVPTSNTTVTVLLQFDPDIAYFGEEKSAPIMLIGSTSQAATSGRAAFSSLSVSGVGKFFSLVFSGAGLSQAASDVFNVTGPPAKLAISRQPECAVLNINSRPPPSEPCVVGRPFVIQPTIQVLDYYGNLVQSLNIMNGIKAGGNVTGNLHADIVQGSATFTDLQFLRAGSFSVVTFVSPSYQVIPGADSIVFFVLSGNPQKLLVILQPTSSSRGLPLGIQPCLTVVDRFQNIVLWYDEFFSSGLWRGGENWTSSLSGTTKIRFNGSEGVASYTDLSVSAAGTDLQLRFTSSGLEVDSNIFSITHGPPTMLILSVSTLGAVIAGGNGPNGILYPQPEIKMADAGFGIVDSFSGYNCMGGCKVSVSLTCCPLDPITGAYAGTAQLHGNTTVLAVGGVATFTDISVSATGIFSLKFSVPAISGISPVLFIAQNNVNVQVPSLLVIETQPDKAILGLPLRVQPVVSIASASGKTVNASINNVTVSIANDPFLGCTILGGTRVVTSKFGVAIFTDLKIIKSNMNKICRFNFSSYPSVAGVLSNTFSLSYGPSQLILVSQPSEGMAGSTLQPQPSLSFQDLTGEIVTSDNGNIASVMLLCTSGPCYTASCGFLGNKQAINYMGKINFTDLRIDRVVNETCSLRFQLGRFSAVSEKFNIVVGIIAVLKILDEPSDTLVGDVLFPAVRIIALDSAENVATNENGTVKAILYPNSAFGITVSGTVCQLVDGISTFDSLKFSSAGALLSIRFSVGPVSVLSQQFSVHGPIHSLRILDFPLFSVNAGQECLPRPEIASFDFENILTSSIAYSNKTISLSLLPECSLSSLCGNSQAIMSQGIAFFAGVRFRRAAQNMTVRFYLEENPSIFVDSSQFTVNSGLPSSLRVLQGPVLAEAGKNLYPWPKLQVIDQCGNVVFLPLVNVTVSIVGLSLCSAVPSLLGSTSQLSFSSIVEFSDLRVSACPGRYKLIFRINSSLSSQLKPDLACHEDFSNSLNYSNCCDMNFSVPCAGVLYSKEFIVKIGNPTLFLQKQPGPGRVGSALTIQPKIRIVDIVGNLFSGSSGEFTYFLVYATLKSSGAIDAVLSDENGPCPCSSRLLNGETQFTSLAIDKASPSNVLEFYIDTLKLSNITSVSFPITGNPVAMQLLEPLPTNIIFNSSISFRVQLLDPNRIAVSSSSVTARIAFPNQNGTNSAQLLQYYASALQGVASFKDIRMNTLGSGLRFQLEAEGIYLYSTLFSVISGEAFRLQIAPENIPLMLISDTVLPVTNITVLDFAGNIANNEEYYINGTVIDSNRSIVQILGVQKTTLGVASFSNVQIQKAGSGFQIVFTTMQRGLLIESETNFFSVTPGKITQLHLISQPGPGIVGQLLLHQPAVIVQDRAGNNAIYFDKSVMVFGASDLNASGIILGNLIVVAMKGIATFTDISILKITAAATLVFYISDNCGLTVSSESFVVTGMAVSLNLTKKVSPPIFGGSVFASQPQLSVFDSSRQLVEAFLCPCIVSICRSNAKGTLYGNKNVNFSGGVAEFTDLEIDLVGNYVLCFQSSTFQVSFPISVGVGPAATVQNINKLPTTNVIQVRADIRNDWRNAITILDAGGNVFMSGQNPPCIITELIQDNDFSSLNPSLLVKRSQLCNYSYLPVICKPYTDPFTGDSIALVSCSRAGVPYELLYEPPGIYWPYLSISAPVGDVKLQISLNPSSSFVTDVFQVTIGDVLFSVVVIQPTAAICNAPWSTTPMVEAQDAGGNTVTDLNTFVTIKVWNRGSYFSSTVWRDISEFIEGCNINTSFIDGIAAFAGCRIQCTQSMVCATNTFRLRFEGRGIANAADPDQLNFADQAWSDAFSITSPPSKIVVNEISNLVSGGIYFAIQPKISFWAENCNPFDLASPPCFVAATDPGLYVVVSIQDRSLQMALLGETSLQVPNSISLLNSRNNNVTNRC